MNGSAQSHVARALAELDARIDADLAAITARGEEAKSKLQSGLLNLREQAEPPSAPLGFDEPESDDDWMRIASDNDISLAADPYSPAEIPLADGATADYSTTELAAFDDEPVATDEDGIPLG